MVRRSGNLRNVDVLELSLKKQSSFTLLKNYQLLNVNSIYLIQLCEYYILLLMQDITCKNNRPTDIINTHIAILKIGEKLPDKDTFFPKMQTWSNLLEQRS